VYGPGELTVVESDACRHAASWVEGWVVGADGDLGATGVHEHLVGAYPTDTALAAAAASFLLPSLVTGGIAVVLATSTHDEMIAAQLGDRGVDVDAARRDGRLLWVDGAETLSRISERGRIDPARFGDVVAAHVAGLSAGGRHVRVFADLVALLWAAGDLVAALDLERLCDELAANHTLSLLCGVPAQLVEAADTEVLEGIVATHTGRAPGAADVTARLPDQARAAALEQRLDVVEARRRAVLRERDDLLADARRARDQDELRRRYVAMVIHDLRGPATTVSGSLELLRDRWPDLGADRVQELLARASTAAERLSRMADDVLNATLESGPFRYRYAGLDLEALARLAAEQAAERSGRVVEVEVRRPLPAVHADADRQHQILDNLLSNAAKYSPPGEPVTVHLDHRGGEVVVAVHDRGSSLTAADAALLFRPYGRLERDTSVAGSGLGLLIVRTLVEGQGGRVWIEPAASPGAGTRFVYTVPVAGSAEAELPPTP
jgi:signal transduction histidine kinase